MCEKDYPAIFKADKKQLPDQKIGMIYHWEGFGNLFEKNIADRDQSYETEKETAKALADYIRNEKPAFTFTQLDDVDKYGHMTREYLAAIIRWMVRSQRSNPNAISRLSDSTGQPS